MARDVLAPDALAGVTVICPEIVTVFPTLVTEIILLAEIVFTLLNPV
jgi:hypothetical protein